MADWRAGMRTTAQRLNETVGLWQDYAGTWTADATNPAVGNGSATYRYMQIGSTVEFLVRIIFGSTTSAGGGNYDFGLPIAPKDHGGGRTISAGATSIIEVASDRYNLGAFLFATGLVRVADDGAGSGIGGSGWDGKAWEETDFIIINGRYEVD